MPEVHKHIVLGLMSGTSLDGLDLALCSFEKTHGRYAYSILRSETVSYSPAWKSALAQLHKTSAVNYFTVHHLYGRYIAAQVKRFLSKGGPVPSLIASHGHTVFHQPDKGFSTQAGCGATIAANTGITTVCDFRSLDVALSGQGAPLVPVGDKLLFSDYKSCLNLGGIANISFDNEKGQRRAFDICVVNMALNYLAGKTGREFDRDGGLARSGQCDPALLKKLDALDFYKSDVPKSAGREWFEQQMLPLIENSALSVEALLSTFSTHIAKQIAAILNEGKLENVLVTGGGAFNTFLMETIRENYKGTVIIPDATTVNFKEALIFAFLGWLRINQTVNTLSSVTGAKQDSMGGAVYLVKS
ncbi:MAG: anhydro-N-acetylmuramic acid kinase [Bacteroidia bacterium]